MEHLPHCADTKFSVLNAPQLSMHVARQRSMAISGAEKQYSGLRAEPAGSCTGGHKMSSSGRSRLRFQLQPVRHPRVENSSSTPYVGPILPASTSSLPKKVPLRYGKYASLLRFYEQSSLSRTDVEKLAKLLSSASNDKLPKSRHADETEASDSDESEVDQLQRTDRVDDHFTESEEKSWSGQDVALKRDKLILSWSDQLKRDDARVVQVRIPDVRVDSDSEDDNPVILTQPNDSAPLNPRIVKQSAGMQLPRSKQQQERRHFEQDEVVRLIDTRLKALPSAVQSSDLRTTTASTTITSPPPRRENSTAWFARAKSHVEDKWRTANAKPSIPLRHTVQDLPFGVTRFGGPSLMQSSPTHAESGKARQYDTHRIRHSVTAGTRYSLKSSYSTMTGASRETWSSADFSVPAPSRMSRERVDSIRVAGTHVGVSARSYMNIVHSPYFKDARPSRATTVMFAE